MNITKEQIKETIKELMSEDSGYKAFFKKALEKAGKSIPSMSDEEKKSFFNKIDAAWDAKGEKNEGNAFGAAVTKAKEAGKDEFEVDGKNYKVEESAGCGCGCGGCSESVNEETLQEDENPCWDGYEMVGMKMKDGKEVPNCVPKNESVNEARLGKVSLLKSVEKGDSSYVEGVKISPELAFELRMFLQRPMLARTRTGIAIDNSQMKDAISMLAKVGVQKRLSSNVKTEFDNLLKKYK